MVLRNMSESLGISISKPEKQKAKNSKQLAKVLERTLFMFIVQIPTKEWVALQNKQDQMQVCLSILNLILRTI